MAKKISSADIKKMLKAGNVIVGTESTLKNLKLGRVEKVLLCSNCSAKAEKDINYYAALSNAELHKLEYQNDELGVICKKPFSISVLAVVKRV